MYQRSSTFHLQPSAFTLPEILVAITIFAAVVTVVAGLYVNSFRETRRATIHNQIYEDARYVMQLLVNEVHNGTIDYDEYYSQSVVMNSGPPPAKSAPFGLKNFGQNFGRYYSSFYHPGTDTALGFDCNNGGRNKRNCTPLRKTIDRNTGSNPFKGKIGGQFQGDQENAFCGTVAYTVNQVFLNNRGKSPDGRDMCKNGVPNLTENQLQKELYLISADGKIKTILAREAIGGPVNDPTKWVYALSLLRLSGRDKNNDGVFERFVCADEFQCRGTDNVLEVEDPPQPNNECQNASPTELPRDRSVELNTLEAACDTETNAFSRDFVPVSPLRITISSVFFYIVPLDDPHYAFGEDLPGKVSKREQPRVTIVLTVAPNYEYTGINEPVVPITLVETVSSRIRTPIPAPVLVF